MRKAWVLALSALVSCGGVKQGEGNANDCPVGSGGNCPPAPLDRTVMTTLDETAQFFCVVSLAAGAGAFACSFSEPADNGGPDRSGEEGGACDGSSCGAAGGEAGGAEMPDSNAEAAAGGMTRPESIE